MANHSLCLIFSPEETLALVVHPSEYMPQLVEYCMVKFHAFVRVKETNQTWSDEDDFVMDKPKLSIRVSGN